MADESRPPVEVGLKKADSEFQERILNERDPYECGKLIAEYYHDADRADRTARPTIYFHMGMCFACISRLNDLL